MMLPRGGHIVFDDLWMPSIRKVIAFALRNKNYEMLSARPSPPAPLWKRLARVGRKLLQDPIGPHWKLKLQRLNIAVLRKTSDDARAWDHYRNF